MIKPQVAILLLTLSSSVLFSSTSSWAGRKVASANLCEDLSAYACAPGLHFDGTGTARRPLPTEVSNDAILLKFAEPLREQMIELLAKPEAAELRKLCEEAHVNEVGLFNLFRKSLGATSAPSEDVTANIEEHPSFKKISMALRRDISRRVTDPKKRSRLEKVIFPEVQRLLVRKINSLPMDARQRAKMAAKVNSVTLNEDSLCQLEGYPHLFRTISVFESKSNSVRVCDGSLAENFSEFKLAHSIGHELSHSIDPCNFIGRSASYDLAENEAKYPLKELVSCLRSEKSIAAKAFPAEPPVSSADHVDTKPVYDFCDGDQINEAFADWLSAEVLGEYIAKRFPKLTSKQWSEGISNVFRFNCDDPSSDDDVHPTLEFRLNRLLLVQPSLRKKMGCEARTKFQHCEARAKGRS